MKPVNDEIGAKLWCQVSDEVNRMANIKLKVFVTGRLNTINRGLSIPAAMREEMKTR